MEDRPFSERYGHQPVRDAIQIDHLDEQVRTRLWNLYCEVFSIATSGSNWLTVSSQVADIKQFFYEAFLKPVWREILKRPIDEIDSFTTGMHELRKIHFNCEWYVVLDILECFVAAFTDDESVQRGVAKKVNEALAKENVGYQVTAGKVTPITDKAEIESIEAGLKKAPSLVRTHLQSALDLMSDRQQPDYRNSIKESISALEGLVKELAGNEKDAFSYVLKQLGLHDALRKSLSNLYGWACDAGGIRHHLKEKANVSYADALFILVWVSATVNYLLEKSSKA